MLLKRCLIAQGRPQRRSDGLSSSPSSYTPLQPGSRGAGRETSRADHTPFQGQPSEMAHPVKMVDKSWHWEDKGMDVSGLLVRRLGWGWGQLCVCVVEHAGAE